MEESCGSGSQGSVVLAKLNNELVCVKIFRNAKVFQQELKMLAAAQKTGYVPILKGAYSADSNHYIVMTYHGKVTLESFLYSNPHPRKVHKILTSLNEAIHSLHSSGIIHNDIKENNILIENQNLTGRLVTVIDFGWSTYVGDSPYPHLSKTQIKDYPWIAPWLAHGGKSSTLSDMYSLGYLFLTLSEKYPCPAYSIFGHLFTSLCKYNFNLGLNICDNELQLKWQYIMSLRLKDLQPMLSDKACSKCLLEKRFLSQVANKQNIQNFSRSNTNIPNVSLQVPPLQIIPNDISFLHNGQSGNQKKFVNEDKNQGYDGGKNRKDLDGKAQMFYNDLQNQ
ncbi:UNVERIFIED_CONTAM: hypothetical protein RMT77_008998 [Armadillidium vulgare]